MGGNVKISLSIILGSLIVAFVIMGMGKGGTEEPTAPGAHTQNTRNNPISAEELKDTTHIFGNPDAPITIVEFSDYECPFCSRLHPILERVVAENPDTVQWRYRHFPLHREAPRTSRAAECIARMAGEEAFFDFSAAAFDNMRSLGPEYYAQEAARHGIARSDLESCMAEDAIQEIIQKDLALARASGGRGTPHNVIISPNGEMLAVPGAIPYEQWTSIINQMQQEI
ncbi:MAG: thioredoxin domain-containing protein [Candidatus Paceibacterota bacterium]